MNNISGSNGLQDGLINNAQIPQGTPTSEASISKKAGQLFGKAKSVLFGSGVKFEQTSSDANYEKLHGDVNAAKEKFSSQQRIGESSKDAINSAKVRVDYETASESGSDDDGENTIPDYSRTTKEYQGLKDGDLQKVSKPSYSGVKDGSTQIKEPLLGK